MFANLPPLNQIRGFEAAARLNSFKAAAEELNVTPTAISHQISNLENKLGVVLFERKPRLIKLTQEGSKLALAAHQAFQVMSVAFEEISTAQSILRVATTTSFASMWLVPNLASFQKQHPEIQIEIKTGEEIIDINRDHRVDLAIRYGCSDNKSERVTHLVTENFGAYSTENYLNSHKNLEDATLIETKWKNKNLPSIGWDNWLEKFYPKLTAPQISFFDQEQHVIQAALAGQGIALASSILAGMALKQGWLKPFDDNFLMPGLSYYLLISPFSEDLRKVAVFKEWLIEELSNSV